MNFTIRHSAVLILILYLCIPVAGFGYADISPADAVELRVSGGISQELPCDQCPCGDEQDSDCCGAALCSCAFHSPPEQTLRIRYAPVVVPLRPTDTFWVLPQVYLPIFVPPQNASATG